MTLPKVRLDVARIYSRMPFAVADAMQRFQVFVPSSNPNVFVARLSEARSLWETAKGTAHEDDCWAYYEAVVRLAAIATGHRRDELRDVLRAIC